MKNDSFCFGIMEERDNLRRQVKKMKNCLNCKFVLHSYRRGFHCMICRHEEYDKEVLGDTFNVEFAACDKWEVLE